MAKPARVEDILPKAEQGDALAQKAAATNKLVASIPFNPNTASEFGHDNAIDPSTGFSARPSSPAVGSSTLSESNRSDKTGTKATEGTNPTTGSLDRVRVDSGGQALTTKDVQALAAGVPAGAAS